MIIALANSKGGVGKTNLTFHLGGAFPEKGEKTLLIDMDFQANLTNVLTDRETPGNTMAEFFLSPFQLGIKELIVTTRIPGLDFIPAGSQLYRLDRELTDIEESAESLKTSLQSLHQTYNWILIDCPPNLTSATTIALAVANKILIPIEAEKQSVRGAENIITFMHQAKTQTNPDVGLLGIVINKLTARRKIESAFYQSLQERYKSLLFRTVFPDHVMFVEAFSSGLPITLYSPLSLEAQSCREMLREIRERCKDEKKERFR